MSRVTLELVVWMFIGIWGVALSAILAKRAHEDVRSARAHNLNGAIMLALKRARGREHMRGWVHALALMLGVAVLGGWLQGWLFSWTLITMQALVTLNSYLDALTRRRAKDYIDPPGMRMHRRITDQ